MFIGKYYYKLQANSRISLPAAFRSQSNQWIVTRGLDGCLFVFPKETFQQEVAQLANRSFTKKAHRDFVRILTNEATEIEADQLGRVRLPDYLIQQAALTQAIVIVGSFSRIEIWDQDRYHSYQSSLENKAEIIAESIEVNEVNAQST